jgi:LysM repeat protein
MKRLASILIIMAAALTMRAQTSYAIYVQNYIQKYKDVAVQEMMRSGIPASITLAQGIAESDCGRSPLATKANNHFGIKCKAEWDGDKYYHDDDAPQECFRVYNDACTSYKDHSEFLTSRDRYAGLFQLNITDYKGWANGLKAAGYATNPKYPQILIALIEDYKLYDYDKIGLALMKKEKKEENDKPVLVQTNENKKEEIAEEKKEKHHHIKNEEETKPITEAKFEIGQDVALEETPSTKTVTTFRNIFEFNGLKVTRALGNEDPLKVALDLGVDYTQLMIFNDLNTGEKFKEGEFIYLEMKRSRGIAATCIVREGDNMRDISQRYGVKMRELYAKNLMRLNDQPLPGEIIYLQDRRTDEPKTMSYADYLKSLKAYSNSAPPAPNEQIMASSNNEAVIPKAPTATVNAAGGYNEYLVQQEDTLYSIARRFNVTVEQLKEWNNLSTANIKIGDKLVVSK